MRIVTCSVLTVALAAGCGGSSLARAERPTTSSSTTAGRLPEAILMVGDSLTFESRDEIADVARGRPDTIAVRGISGSAPCDWTTRFAGDVGATHPSVVGILFNGNVGSPCMRDAAGTPLSKYSTRFLHRYRSALLTLVGIATGAGARVVLFEPPPFRDQDREAGAERIHAMIERIARSRPDVSTSPAVRRALSRHGRYSARLPCRAGETEADGCVGGRIAIRSLHGPDAGVHLCPTGLPAGRAGVCAVYASGEVRFAEAVVGVLSASPES